MKKLGKTQVMILKALKTSRVRSLSNLKEVMKYTNTLKSLRGCLTNLRQLGLVTWKPGDLATLRLLPSDLVTEIVDGRTKRNANFPRLVTAAVVKRPLRVEHAADVTDKAIAMLQSRAGELEAKALKFRSLADSLLELLK